MKNYDPEVADALKTLIVKEWSEDDTIKAFDPENPGAFFTGKYTPCDLPGMVQVGFLRIHVAEWDFERHA